MRRLVLPMLLVAGCAGKPPPAPLPASLSLAIAGGAGQNPDQAGQAAPVAVRLLFLASTTAFERADVFALTESERATLGPDDLGSQEVIIRPGQGRTIEAKPAPGTTALGIVVLFRDIDHARWRAEAPVAANGPTRLTLAIKGLDAVLAPAKPTAVPSP